MTKRINFYRFLQRRDGYDIYTRPGYWIDAEKTWHNYELMGLDRFFKYEQEFDRDRR